MSLEATAPQTATILAEILRNRAFLPIDTPLMGKMFRTRASRLRPSTSRRLASYFRNNFREKTPTLAPNQTGVVLIIGRRKAVRRRSTKPRIIVSEAIKTSHFTSSFVLCPEARRIACFISELISPTICRRHLAVYIRSGLLRRFWRANRFRLGPLYPSTPRRLAWLALRRLRPFPVSASHGA